MFKKWIFGMRFSLPTEDTSPVGIFGTQMRRWYFFAA
jgi:hypothetical protein